MPVMYSKGAVGAFISGCTASVGLRWIHQCWQWGSPGGQGGVSVGPSPDSALVPRQLPTHLCAYTHRRHCPALPGAVLERGASLHLPCNYADWQKLAKRQHLSGASYRILSPTMPEERLTRPLLAVSLYA